MERPHLQTIIFEVTQACNHACLHCYNTWNHPGWRGPRLNGHGDVRPLLAHVLDQVDCRHVTLTGGEPTLRDDLPEIVSFLNGRGVGVTLISNGHRLTDDDVRDLIDRGVGLFELPLLSHRREVHDALSGSPGAFDAVLAALANIRYHGGQVVAAFVATRRNLPDLADTLKLAFAFGVRGVMLNRFNPGGRGAAHIEDLLPGVEEMRAALETAEAAAQGYRLLISCSIPIQPCLIDTTPFKHLGFGFCAAGSDRAYYTLSTTGDVRPCNHTPTVLGNAWREPFAAIIQPSRMAGFIAAIPPCCEPCPRRDECQGGCKASAQVCYGDLRAEEPFLRLGHRLAQDLKEELP
jgi:radical SAM protein with 4Fe4S-binding SPASM domain